MDYEHALNMAKLMKARDGDIVVAIKTCQKANHGVVALRYSERGTKLEIEILDEDYSDKVQVFPGK